MNTLNYYNQNANNFITDTVSVNFGKTQDEFLSFVPAGGQILDFGCGSGRDAKYFLDKGYQVDAIDGSIELCKLASDYTGISVQHMFFEQLAENNLYDGIWACASILHLKKPELAPVILKMVHATKTPGMIYISFKYGTFEGWRGERYYTDMTEDTFQQLITDIPDICIEKMWVTGDVRPDRADEKWLNILMRKQ